MKEVIGWFFGLGEAGPRRSLTSLSGLVLCACGVCVLLFLCSVAPRSALRVCMSVCLGKFARGLFPTVGTATGGVNTVVSRDTIEYLEVYKIGFWVSTNFGRCMRLVGSGSRGSSQQYSGRPACRNSCSDLPLFNVAVVQLPFPCSAYITYVLRSMYYLRA